PGNRYILGGHNLFRSEFYRRLCRCTASRRPRVVPGAVLTALACLTDGLQWASGGRFQSPLHRRFARSQGLHYCGHGQAAIDDLGYPARPLEDSILEMVQQDVERGRLSSEFEYLRDLPPCGAEGFLLLRQLASAHQQRAWLLQKFPPLWEACRNNLTLGAALEELLEASEFDSRRARYRWPRRCRRHVRQLNLFLDHMYFSSDQFLGEVL
ncbi:MAG: hypothetical protein MI861_17910, partial [Pirellulales bacterium]|nr:hypothetical protein [Pirellulales bacterium]